MQSSALHNIVYECSALSIIFFLYPMSKYEFSVYYNFSFRKWHYKQLLLWKVNGLNLVNHYWKDNELFGMSNITIQALKIILFLFAFYIILFLFYFYPNYLNFLIRFFFPYTAPFYPNCVCLCCIFPCSHSSVIGLH